MHTVLAATATLLAGAFALSTLERYLARGSRHELMWTISLFMFALGSLALWAGAAIGWSEWTFKAFYLFGAILNVPFLALGTVYLLAGRQRGDVAAATVSLLAAFAAGIVVATPIVGVILSDVLPQGSDVFGPGPRIAAGVGSGVAAVVIIGGAVWSAVQLLLGRRRSAAAPATSIPAGRLAAANLLIAAGTIVGVISSDVLPQGSDVFGPGPRIAAGVGSGVAALVIIGGAVWSAVQLLLGRRRSAAAPATSIPAGRLAAANLLIAAGTIVLSAGGLLNSVVDEMDAFAISLVVGIAIIFAGFLLTTVSTPAARGVPPIRGSLEPGPVTAADPAVHEHAARQA